MGPPEGGPTWFFRGGKTPLKAPPNEPFESALWRECTVHYDHHIVFDRSYYCLPTRYIGKRVWVRVIYLF